MKSKILLYLVSLVIFLCSAINVSAQDKDEILLNAFTIQKTIVQTALEQQILLDMLEARMENESEFKNVLGTVLDLDLLEEHFYFTPSEEGYEMLADFYSRLLLTAEGHAIAHKQKLIPGILKHLYLEGRSIVRNFGITIGILMLATEIAQNVAGIWLTSIGYPEFGTAAHIIPFPTIVAAMYYFTQNIIDKSKYKKSFEGKDFFILYKQSLKKAKKEYQLKNKHKYASFLKEGDKVYALMFRKERFFQKITSPLRSNHKLTLLKFKKYLKHSAIELDETQQAILSEKIPSELRLWKLIFSLWEDAEFREKFKLDYKQNLVEVKHPKHIFEFSTWASTGIVIESLEELSDWLEHTPENMNKGMLLNILKTSSFKFWSEHMENTPLKIYRKFMKEIQYLKNNLGLRRLEPASEKFIQKELIPALIYH